MSEPQQIGDYEIVGVLGRGGMGIVYEARHGRRGAAALKTVRAPTESTLESIRREIEMLRELQHPGVVAIRDHGVTPEGAPWYAMDLLEGRTLRDDLRAWFPTPVGADDSTRDLKSPGRSRRETGPGRARRGEAPPFSFAHIATLFRKICEPLAYVHGQGVIHRDLSPANIFLVADDDPVLFDFGLAAPFRAEDARELLVVGGYARGTAHYMAPEQARGEVVDARADIYALGCLLYEALTGRPPFLDDDIQAVLSQHLAREPLPPSQLAPGAAPFDALVLRMLAKRPRDRFGYAEDVGAALERLGATRPPAATTHRPQPRAYTYRPELAGRAESLTRCDALIGRLVDGVGGAATVVGESGAGKTRLAGEIATRAAATAGVRVITGECEPVAVGDPVRAAPLHPLRPLLRAIVDRCREGNAEDAEWLLGRGRGDGALLAAYEPALAPLVAGDATPARGGGPGARLRVLAALRDVIAALAYEDPLLLVLDDLQWADELTLAFLRSLTPEWFARTPVLVLVTLRANEITPELQATLDALAPETIPIARLDRAAIGAMVSDMLALDAAVPALAEYVASRSGGNPLFAAEYLRIAVDEGVVQRDHDGRWRLAQRDEDSYDRLPTPGSVQEIGQRRLAQLGVEARVVVVAAAVLGRVFDARDLAATVGVDAATVARAIADLMRRHVIEEADGRLRFEHDSLRELAYGSISAIDRPALHRRAALALEAHDTSAPAFALRHAELAHHWEVAGDVERAMTYLEESAERALDAAAYGEARSQLEHLLQLGAHAPGVKRGRWLRRLGEASYALGDVAGLATHTRSALDALGRPLPASRLRLAANVANGLRQQLWTRTLRRRPVALAADADVEAALASAQMTTHFFFNDDSLGLIGAALAAVNLAERGGGELPIAEIYAQLGYAAGIARLGGVARTYFAQARATAGATRDTLGLIKTINTEAAFAIGIGAWPEARTAATDALALARSARQPQELEDALTILGHVEFATGHYPLAGTLATALRESARGRANAQHEAWGIYTEGRVALYTGDLDGALDRFERAMAMLARQHDRASLILCGGMQAAALARAGDPRARDAAEGTARRIGGKTPPVFSITEGLVGLSDAYLELWRRSGDASLAAPAFAATRELAKLARLLPIAGPAAAIHAGRAHLLAGSRRRATRLLRRGLRGAEQLALPYDQAVAHAALAEARTGRDAADHREEARRAFTSLGCRWHLEHR